MSKVAAGAMFKIPAPEKVPPVQLNMLLTVIVPGPFKVPPLSSKSAWLFSVTLSPSSKETVPPVNRSAPVPLMFTFVLTTWAPPVKVIKAPVFMLRVPPGLNVWAPPEKFRVDPAAALKLPLLVPPLGSTRMPLCTLTVPLLLNTVSNVVVPPPADLTNVPLLLKIRTAPLLR